MPGLDQRDLISSLILTAQLAVLVNTAPRKEVKCPSQMIRKYAKGLGCP